MLRARDSSRKGIADAWCERDHRFAVQSVWRHCHFSSFSGTLEPGNCTNVHYKDTELILTCSECNLEHAYNILWTKDDCNRTKNIFARGQNITINADQRRLTNDDSGTYCCMCKGQQYQIHVNILGKF